MIVGALICVLLAGCQAAESDIAGGEPPDDGAGEEAPFFVGHWAAEEGMCRDAAWDITPTRLTTPGHVVCDFEQVTPSPEGYRINATCTAEGPPAPHLLEVSYAQSAGALLIEGGPFAPIGLVACH